MIYTINKLKTMIIVNINSENIACIFIVIFEDREKCETNNRDFSWKSAYKYKYPISECQFLLLQYPPSHNIIHIDKNLAMISELIVF